ncbi:MAG: hypothetical protein Q7K57_37465 [Burkholderiaceae bacterium]|nr:hypothetical protein [Burkholderiaceae bacterium]
MPATATDKAPKVLPAKDVFKLYAAHLESQSWCIDFSGTTSMALHAASGFTANLDYFSAKPFSEWSGQSGIRVIEDEYANFLSGLRLKLPKRLHSILGSTMRPTPQPFISVNGAMFANTYVAYAPPRPVDCSAPLAEELLTRLFPDESERTWCKQFIAHAVQKPLERPQHGLLITGDGSTCKSSLMRLARAALGGNRHFYSRNEYTQAMQKFSEVVPDNLLIVFDDVPPNKVGNAYESLKDTITRDTQTVELKGTQKYVTREVYSRIVVISNLKRPLRLVDDRRFFAPAYCVHPVDKADSEAFGAKLSAWLLEPGTAAILYHWFMDVDLKNFTVSGCPRTETLIQMEGASTPALERHICTFIEDRTEGDKKPIFHEKDIAAYLEAAGLQRVSQDEIAHKLTTQGYEQKRRCLEKDDKKQIHLWSPVCKRARTLTDAEVTLIKEAMRPSF